MDAEIERALDRWAAQSGSEAAKTLVTPLGSAYRAAARFQEAVDVLVRSSGKAKSEGQALYQLRTWLYEELYDQAEAMRGPLDQTIAETYGRSGDKLG